jgi:hypothetical protein
VTERKTSNAEITSEQMGEIVRIVDSELDVDAILEEIRANLAKRPPLDPDPASFVYRPGDVTSISGQMEIDWQIEQAAEYARTLTVGDQLRPGLGAVSRITTRLKRPLHQLVRYYVDLLAQRQSALEGHVVGALRGLAARSSANEEELKKLRAEIERLRAKLAELEPKEAAADEAVLR